MKIYFLCDPIIILEQQTMLHFFCEKLTPQDYSIIIHIYSWKLPVCCYSLCLFSSKLLTLLQFPSIFPLCVIPLSDYNVLRLIIMHKRLVVNIFSSLLLGLRLFPRRYMRRKNRSQYFKSGRHAMV
nr:Uncharacterised protein [Klebsiella pneumoniae]